MELTELLACPSCGSSLTRIDDAFACSGCELTAPVVRGIPRFVGDEAYTESFGYQWSTFRTTQLDRDSDDESAVTFREKTGINPLDLRGKRVLDVGCGMGRFAEVCARSGAQLIGVDLSNAVEPANENLGAFPDCHVIQADIFDLPFAEETFDAIYSIGVLHHTPDTKEAFLRLPRLLKPGGQIAIWVYSAERRDLLASGLKYTYRRVTPRLNHKMLLKLSRAAIPLYSIHTKPAIGFFSRKILPTSMHPDPEWRVLDTFDDYSPRYRWRHTYDEVLGWFAQAKMTEIEALEPRVAVRGRKP
ncbi:MAG: class I SAM-dependent methyltransferase [Acidobacteria bacterium]|nr:MAG: class I SAM-dependent methyltransferase [Acidobacteriota bacterium]